MTLSLEAVEVENLRGYFSTLLDLKSKRIVVVGPNNTGKTSMFRLLNWVFNELDIDRIKVAMPLSYEEQSFLLPARDAKHRARRLTLYVRLSDARGWRKFECRNGVSQLRFNIRLTPNPTAYVALGSPKRGESTESNSSAIELLNRLRSEWNYIYIPSFRDAKSERFESTLHQAFRGRIEERALHSGQAGAPKEHRDVARSKNELEKTLLQLVSPMLSEVREKLPPGLAKDAKLDFDCDQATFLAFLESKLCLRISTGKHDHLAVAIDELGSGLQSLLDLTFQLVAVSSEETKGIMLAAEEPEAFLHPSAQRTIAQRLLSNQSAHQVLITTHSPVVVEEARFGDLVLCREHKYYHPSSVCDQERVEINTALLSGYGAEMAFGNAILLVEGEGDRQFFETIRRRISPLDDTGLLDTCFVVPVGGKERFGPWIRLFRAYGNDTNRPIRWLSVPDGDACKDIRKAYLDAGQTLTSNFVASLFQTSDAFQQNDFAQWRNKISNTNRISRISNLPVHILQCDLEESILGNAGQQLVSDVAIAAGWQASLDRDLLLKQLGSKFFGGSSNGKKDAYLRAFVAHKISPEELTSNLRSCLKRWFTLVMSEGKSEALLRKWGA